MIDKKKILIKVKSFLTEYFPHAYGVMITGSFLTEKFNETSDVDIIIQQCLQIIINLGCIYL